jgi:hypothetical protein
MGYYNPIYVYGVERFLADAKAAGVDGLIVVDLPPEEDVELCLPALAAGLNFIRLATPTTDDARLPKVLTNTSGFVYYVSITGITGTKAPMRAGWAAKSPASSAHTDLPVCGRLRGAQRQAGAEIAAGADGGRGRLGAGGGGAREPRRRRQGDGGDAGRGARAGGGACRRACAPAMPPPRYPFGRSEEPHVNWIKNFVRPKIRSFLGARREVAENMWVKDPDSGQMVFYRDLEANQFVVPTSGFHMRMPPARACSTCSTAASMRRSPTPRSPPTR